MAIGDFNATLSSNEKTGGLSGGKRYLHFGNFVDLVNLHDLGFRGHPFTWHRGNLFERLDYKFTENLKEWNKTTYGYTTTRKRNLIHKLSTVQGKKDLLGANHLAPVEMEIRRELENVLHHEELLWKQKAQCD
ncbi:hypothetical protein PVK06_016998 [Gossypium arboreum]|uniref:Uncharacterized protein n=1 Tax=Gossypium arboreum TaxID=29729 RepID=A0ABR0Q2N7_GOSAR|nr:hypothetical protein PVK06_016998 [Gossypium arboreum]